MSLKIDQKCKADRQNIKYIYREQLSFLKGKHETTSILNETI